VIGRVPEVLHTARVPVGTGGGAGAGGCGALEAAHPAGARTKDAIAAARTKLFTLARWVRFGFHATAVTPGSPQPFGSRRWPQIAGPTRPLVDETCNP